MKPVNWISATGFSPAAAMPTATPAIAVSASGVSITRSGPKRCWRPAVARKTPPFAPTSSPSTTTDSSRSSSWASAMLTASMRFFSAMGIFFAQANGKRPLLLERLGHLRVQVIEHVLGRPRGRGFVRGHRLRHLAGALVLQRLLLVLVPVAVLRQVIAQPRDRLDLPRRVHAFGVAVARRVVGRRVIAQAIAHRFDERGPAAAARLLEGLLHHLPDRDHVVAIHLAPL